ncbi:MAG: hypothetical protein PHD03_04885 [Bacilli bacterium]|nr:hypothetical protein [Bacilli bacterium]MDD4734396.1 hypothetical protein [Bacilli bacterium]
MCNINIMITKSNKKKEIKKAFSVLKNGCISSYATNSDGDGYFINNRIKKSFDFLNKDNLLTEFYKAKMIITHQRITTSGHNFMSLQPFQNDRFVFVHNGILSNSIYNIDKNKSDSLQFFELFQEKIKKNDCIEKVLKEMLEIEKGYYSISIFDKENNKLYYVKNDRATINFYLINNESLYITTSNNNYNFIEEPYKIIEIKNLNVYEININNLDIFSLLEYKEPKQEIFKKNWYDHYNYEDYSEDEKDFYSNYEPKNKNTIDKYL